MRRSVVPVFVCLSAAVACGTFGTASSSDDTLDAATPPPGQPPPPPSGTDGYLPDASVVCVQDDAGACRAPAFCCARGGLRDSCETVTCAGGTGNIRVHCRDDTPCAAGFACCMRVSDWHTPAAACEANCATSVTAPGAGVVHLCAESRDCGDAGHCVPIRDVLRGELIPPVDVNVCQ